MTNVDTIPSPVALSVDLVEKTLDVFFDTAIEDADKMSVHYAVLWREMRRLVTIGGKRLRPRMVLLAYEAFGGKDTSAIVPVAAATEILHASLLMHDDIIDRDYVRYGVPNVSGGYQTVYKDLVADEAERSHYANSAALMGGDLLLSAAYQLVGQSSLAPAQLAFVYKQLGETIFQVAGGELLDTESALRPVGAIQSELVALHKTASYTFVAPLLTGAALAGISDEQKVFLRIYAENLGVAFQLQDDVLGVFGDSGTTGKSTIGDLREGKRTYMVEQFFAVADKTARQEFEATFGHESLTDEQAERLRTLLIEAGARQRTEEVITLYEQRARQALAELHISEADFAHFNDLTDKAVRRSK